MRASSNGEPEQCALPLRQPVDSLRFTTVATGATHSCAITGDGVLYCWGENDHGQLGSGFREPLGPTAVRAGALDRGVRG